MTTESTKRSEPGELSDEQLDKIDDDFVLHHMAPRGRESVRGFARAVIAADRAARPQSVDARRYRWLRKLDADGIQVYEGANDRSIFGDELDAAIDAAIARGEQTR